LRPYQAANFRENPLKAQQRQPENYYRNLLASSGFCLSYHKTSKAPEKLKNTSDRNAGSSNRIQIKGICFMRRSKRFFAAFVLVCFWPLKML
jgi:hypothetical protein